MSHLADILTASSARYATSTAIVEPNNETTLTYGDLANRVTVLGIQLENQGLAKGQLVALLLHKSPASVVALLGSLAARAAYVPLDINSTVSRNSLILSDCRPAALFTSGDAAPQLDSNLPCRLTELACSEPGLRLYRCDWDELAPARMHPDLAMVLYTSGSTGQPKGVQITHGNALCFVQWCVQNLPLKQGGTCVSIAPFHFDLSVFDLFVSLHRGAGILLLDQKACQNPLLVVQYLQQYAVNVCYSTPTMLRVLHRYGRMARADLSALTHILFAGEPYPPQALNQLRQTLPDVLLFNLYGPTETNVITSYQLPAAIENDRTQAYPIGQACDHTNCFLLVEEHIRSIAPGLEGELLVAGPSVTPGYLANPTADERAFMDGPDGLRLYCTGDIVSTDAEGQLSFLFRRDRMVKRRGYRIQLEEIEQALNLSPQLSDAAVDARAQGDEVLLTAFICPVPEATGIDVRALKQHCLALLPQYFLPDKFTELNSLPKTSSGKIDYQALKGLPI